MNTYYLKKDLRTKIRRKREQISSDERAQMSEAILKNVLSLNEYKKCQTLLCYVSTEMEVDTINIIGSALKDGKKVAVPRCVENLPLIEFYCIKSLSELENGSYGLLEPKAEPQNRYEGNDGLCILPGLAFDKFGGRLGYGKGYYDRFLQNFKGDAFGICFSKILSDSPLPTGRFDIPVKAVVTDKEIIRCR